MNCKPCCRRVAGIALGLTWGMTIAVQASAEQGCSASNGRFALELKDCPTALTEEVRRFISIEVGDLLYDETEALPVGADTLTIRCAGNFAWIEAACAPEVAPLEKLLRLDAFPADAAPRALALASLELMAARNSTVRERMDGNRSAPPQKLPPPSSEPVTPQKSPVPNPSLKSTASHRETQIGLAGVWRKFPAEHGPTLWGGRVQASTTIAPVWQLAVDAEVASGQIKVSLGKTRALLLSGATTFGVRTGGSTIGAGLGLGGRVGMVRLSGSSADPIDVTAATVWRPWGGPMAAANCFPGFGQFTVLLTAEAGQSLLKPEGQAGGVSAISLRGPWAALSLGANIRL